MDQATFVAALVTKSSEQGVRCSKEDFVRALLMTSGGYEEGSPMTDMQPCSSARTRRYWMRNRRVRQQPKDEFLSKEAPIVREQLAVLYSKCKKFPEKTFWLQTGRLRRERFANVA